jgi:D-amino-acid dehydrogenase
MKVVVVGAGVVGLCTAWSLQRRGHDVVVLDGAAPRDAASWGNAGWVVPSLSPPVPAPGVPVYGLRSLVTPGAVFRMRPTLPLVPWLLAFTRSCTKRAHDQGTQATLAICRDVHPSFDALRASGVAFTLHSKGMRFVGRTRAAAEHELEALAPAAALGYQLPAQIDDAEATRAAEPLLSENAVASVYLSGDQHLDPRELVAGLEEWLAEHHVPVHRDREVLGFGRRGGVVTEVRTAAGAETADAVVVAAGAWSRALVRDLGYRLPLQAGKGYSFSVDLRQRPSTPLYLLEARVGVTEMAGRVRFAGMMELSGIDPRVDPRRVQAMAGHASSYVREWGPLEEQWAGLRPMTPDGLPVIGQLPDTENAYVATGHAMLGVTLGPVTGEAVADLLDGKDDARFRAFAPDRFTRGPRHP